MSRLGSTIGEGVVGVLLLIVFAFNMFAGIVGGIWLLCIGQWRIVLGGFVASITMPWWWIWVSLPSLGLGYLCILCVNKEKKVGVAILGFIAGLYDSFLIMGWLALVFAFFLITSFEKDITLFPMLLSAYSIATSPLLYMASKEPPDSENTNLTMTIVVIGSILVVILSLLGVPLIYPLILLAVLMILRTILMVILSVSMIPKQETDYFSDICTRSEGEDEYDQETDYDT